MMSLNNQAYEKLPERLPTLAINYREGKKYSSGVCQSQADMRGQLDKERMRQKMTEKWTIRDREIRIIKYLGTLIEIAIGNTSST